MRPCLVVVCLTLCAPVAGAQWLGSEPRNITLVAVKAPVESLDAVRVTTEPAPRAAAAEAWDARATVTIREDMRCEIRVRGVAPADIASAPRMLARDVDGTERAVSVGAPVTLFRGWCRATDAPRVMTLHVMGATPATHGLSVIYEVLGTPDGGATRRWFTEVEVGAAR